MNKPIRVLHAIGHLCRGGIETWLMEVARTYHPTGELQLDFLVHTDEPGHMDDEARKLGCKIIVCKGYRNPLNYSRKLTTLIQENGPYDVVHSHIHFMSGMVMRAAKNAGVPLRLAHSHNTMGSEPGVPYVRRLYQNTMRHLLHRNCTHGIGCSALAGKALFGAHWDSSPKYFTYYAGIHLEPFKKQYDSVALHNELDIPQDALIIGHVGAFRPEKNHPYVLRIGEELCALRDDAYIVMVGDGPELEKIKAYTAASPFAERFKFTGSIPGVASVMKGLFDAFILPSFHEGLPHVGLEVQAAGFPTIFSDRITDEVAVIPELTHYMSIDLAARKWAEKLIEIAQETTVSKEEAFTVMENSPFNIDTAVKKLYRIYAGRQQGAADETAIAA